jgi:DNA-binding SARP family transcriptional activator/tetratricopeptide (TPR) repeat protein
MPGHSATVRSRPGAPPSAATQIRLCGVLRVVIEGEDVTARLPSRQGRALFAFLALRRDHGVTRDELQEALWPTDPPGDPAASLNSILARVRRAVGGERVVGRAQLSLQLEPDAVIDIEQARIDARRAEEALVAGDPGGAIPPATAALDALAPRLLPELDLPWVESERMRIDELQDRLLETRARTALRLGGDHLVVGEQDARALVRRNPFSETGHELLIEAQGRRGNVAEALQTFEALKVRLRDELGALPSPGVSELHERLLVHGSPSVPPLAPAPPARAAAPAIPLPRIGGASQVFVGRDAALGGLTAAWAATAPDVARLVLVVGESGVGKTQLAGRFARLAHAHGATVLHGRCDEEAIVPFQPFVEALRYYLRYAALPDDGFAHDRGVLARLVPELRAAHVPEPTPSDDSQLERYYLFEAVARVFAQAAERGLVLILDDLHWADKPTILLLNHLLRIVPAGRLAVLAVLRGYEVAEAAALGDVIAELRPERRVDRIELQGLDERETGELLAARLDRSPPADVVRALRAETAGNPLFIEEAARSLRESCALRDGEASLEQVIEGMGLPEGVNDVVAQRLARLPAAAVDALEIASAVGADFGLRAVGAVSRHKMAAVLDGLEAASRAGLVAEDPEVRDRYAFCHALVRRAIYRRLGKGRRAALHAELGEHLEGRPGVTAAELAHHFALSFSLVGPEPAVRHCVAAGREAAQALAYEDAERHLRHALDLLAWSGEDRPGERCRVLLLLGRVCWRLGESGQARDAFLQAARLARERGDAQALARAALGLGERYWEANLVDREYGALLGEALEALGTDDCALRARVLARFAENLHFTAEHGLRASAEAVAMARRLGDRPALMTALMARHVVLLDIEHLDERVAIIEEMLALGGGRDELSAEAYHWRLYDLAERGDLGAAKQEHTRLAELATVLNQPLFRHVATAWEGVFAELEGDVATVERLVAQSLALGRRAQTHEADSVRVGKLFGLRRLQGRADELPGMIRALSEPVRAMTPWRAALALAHVETGDVAAGREHFERLASRDFATVGRGFFWLGSMALLAEACVALEDRARAARLHALLAPYAGRIVQVSYTSCWGSVERYLGLLAAVAGDAPRAEAHFRAALARHEAIGAVPLSAVTRCDHAAMLARAGDRGRAAELAAAAEAAARAHGLDGLARRAAGLRA